MWPTWVFSLMALIAALLSLFLAWELIKDINAKCARWWKARRLHRDHVAYVERGKQYAREALR